MIIRDFPLPSDYSEAILLQKQLVKRLKLEGDLTKVDLIAGADVSSQGRTGLMVGAVVVWSIRQGRIIAQATAAMETQFPYIPGLLAFRELPALLEAFHKLDVVPDAVICDGQGIAHPRGLGIAAHLGLYLDIPTVGCGKSRLVGEYDEPDTKRGSFSPLIYHSRGIGCVVRTRDNVKPVFISPGHLCGVNDAVKLVLRTTIRFRLPEPIRAADRIAGEMRRKLTGKHFSAS